MIKGFYLILLLSPGLLARDLTTLDGRAFSDCTVSRVLPDGICVLFSGGGARLYFTNLTDSVRTEFGYDPERAAEFARAESVREERERKIIETQRLQLMAQQRAWATNSLHRATNTPNRTPFAAYGGPSGGGGLAGGYNNGFGNQSGNGRIGAEYVGVRMVWPGGGVRGIVAAPVQPRPWSTNSP